MTVLRAMTQPFVTPSSSPLAQPAAPNAVTREELHWRRIDMRGFRRSDGLYEVEGRVCDRKPHDHNLLRAGRMVPKGEPIHDMGVRLVFDEAMVVHEVHTFTDAAPYGNCAEGGQALQSLKGLKLASGWSAEVRSRLGGERSCAHLRELLLPLATAAFQSLSALRANQPDRLDKNGRPIKINSCYAYGAQRELVLQYWPQFHEPAAAAPLPQAE